MGRTTRTQAKRPQKTPPQATRRQLAWAGLGSLGLSLATGALVRAGTPAPDRWLHDLAVSHRGPVVGLARTLTEGGSTTVVWPMIIIASLAFPRSRGRARWLTSAAVAGGAGAAIGARLLLSDVVQRARPPAADWATAAGGYAFPSGHTNAATIGAGVLAWAITRHLAGRRQRVAVWVAAGVWAAVVGVTRVLLGVHWPLDVLGGWLFGAGWLAAMAAVLYGIRLTRSGRPGEDGGQG